MLCGFLYIDLFFVLCFSFFQPTSWASQFLEITLANMLKLPDQDHDIGDKIIRAFSSSIKSNPHTKKLKHLDSHMSLNLTPEQSENRVIMLGFCLSLILLGACSILTSMGIYQRLQKEDQKITIHIKHTESKIYTILVIIFTYIGTILNKL